MASNHQKLIPSLFTHFPLLLLLLRLRLLRLLPLLLLLLLLLQLLLTLSKRINHVTWPEMNTEEIRQQVFSYLPDVSLVKCGLTCKSWLLSILPHLAQHLELNFNAEPLGLSKYMALKSSLQFGQVLGRLYHHLAHQLTSFRKWISGFYDYYHLTLSYPGSLLFHVA